MLDPMNELVPGRQITPSLRLVRPLKDGGMGSVWVADHLGLRTHVVIKFMSEALATSPEAIARFSAEAAAASLVKSPHVVHMIDHGLVFGDVPFIAMELLDGHDLGHRLAAERVLPPRQVATIVAQVAKALARAHERGVVHRDIKPDNIFLSDGGGGEAFVKVLDFGIAKGGNPEQMSQTKTGAALGTPYYMSPEQVVGAKAIDHRTDLWSLGVVAFEALTGKVPFEGETIGALALAVCHGPLPVPSKISPALSSSIDAGVDAWFARACARNPEERFVSAKELSAAFEAAVGGFEPVPFVRAEVAPDAPESAEGQRTSTSPAAQSTTAAPAFAKSRPTFVGTSESLSPTATLPRRTSRGVAAAAVGGVAIVAIASVAAVAAKSRSDAPSGATHGYGIAENARAAPSLEPSPGPTAPLPPPPPREPITESSAGATPPASAARPVSKTAPMRSVAAAPGSASGTKAQSPAVAPSSDPFGNSRR
jgi:serine/threonine protein kinase